MIIVFKIMLRIYLVCLVQIIDDTSDNNISGMTNLFKEHFYFIKDVQILALVKGNLINFSIL